MVLLGRSTAIDYLIKDYQLDKAIGEILSKKKAKPD